MDYSPITNIRSTTRDTNLPIEVYGTNWCAATQMLRRYLDKQGISYTYRNMDEDSNAARQVQWWTGGFLSHPTFQIGGNVLVEPSLDEVRLTLMRLGIL